MQISCERCSTVYVLDDKLIPPGGAPVQCTRCGLVFTAKPAPGAVAVVPAPKPTAPPKPMQRLPTPHVSSQPPADERRSTMMFGAQGGSAPAPAPAAPSAGHSTMMFGGAGGAPMPSSAPAPAPAAPSAGHSTMMFGGVGGAPMPSSAPAPAPAPAAASRSTMVFGAVPAAPVAAPPVAAPQKSPAMTQMFGAAGAPAAAPAAPSSSAASTLMFGISPLAGHPSGQAAAPAMSPTPAPAPRGGANSTMMFGAAPAFPEVVKPAGPPPAAIPAAASSTMMFGSAAGATEPPQVDRAPAAEMPTPKAPARTVSKPPPARAKPQPKVEDPDATQATVDDGSANDATDPHLAPVAPQQPVAPAPAWLSPQGSGSEEEQPPAPKRSAARAKPAPAPVPMQAPPPPRAPAQPMVGSQTMELQMSLKKRQRTLPIVLGAVVAILAITAGVVTFLKMRTPPADPALVAADGKAFDLLKRDDEASLLKAIALWEELGVKAPEYVPAKANLMVAHVLMNQDLRDETRRLLTQYQQLGKDLAKLEEKKEPADWRAKATVIREEMVKVKATYDPLQEEATRHDEKSGELLKVSKALVDKLQEAGDGTAVFRASALYYASKGQDATEKLADFYRKNPDLRNVLHDDQRAFADLAVAGRYAQQRVTPGDRDKAKAAAEAALQKDPKLLRAYLFLAKVYFANKEYPAAIAEADKLLGLNPEHKAAERLKAEVQQAEAAAKKAAEKASEKAAEQ